MITHLETARLLFLLVQHPGFIALLPRDGSMHFLVMQDHLGRSWSATGKLEEIVHRAYAELPLTE
jgi:hypothetical protein